MRTRLTLVHAVSSLHAGIGQGAGVIDLPIAREKATGLPFLPGSSLKGALRTRCPQEKRERIFGSEVTNMSTAQASPVIFSDQHMLLFPVRSMAGTFAWVTSPFVLQRFARDVSEVPQNQAIPSLPLLEQADTCFVAEASKLRLSIKENDQAVENVYLEDIVLKAQPDLSLTEWANWLGQRLFPDQVDDYWRKGLTERICLIHDDIFHFISRHATEVTARIKLQENSKTVEEGGLWYEEALPTETILSGLAVIIANQHAETEIAGVLEELTKTTLQLGGKATVGRGMCRVRLI